MKILVDMSDENKELEIIIKCSKKDNVAYLISKLESEEKKLIGKSDDTLYMLQYKDILYIETVDKKSFIYTKDKVFESLKKLYQLEVETSPFNFIRISKSTIVNIMEISTIKRMYNSIFELEMSNGEKVMVSRGYMPVLKERLGFK